VLQRWLAAWLVAVLAIAPFARPLVPIELAAPAVSPEALVMLDDTQGKKPAAGVPPAQPFTLGILSRLTLLDTTHGPPPVKPPLLRTAAHQPLRAVQAATAPGVELREVFQRSSVGTARTPTGPPA
jgi:hypothetical protein